jgi:hypothetical protein
VKKFLATILAIIYFTASTGAAVNIHYCMGKLQSMDFGRLAGKKKVCSKCGMANKKGCCEDKHQVVKLDKKYTVPVTVFSATKFISLPTKFYSIEPLPIRTNEILDYSSSNSPPGKGNLPLFIRNCVFRI